MHLFLAAPPADMALHNDITAKFKAQEDPPREPRRAAGSRGRGYGTAMGDSAGQVFLRWKPQKGEAGCESGCFSPTGLETKHPLPNQTGVRSDKVRVGGDFFVRILRTREIILSNFFRRFFHMSMRSAEKIIL